MVLAILVSLTYFPKKINFQEKKWLSREARLPYLTILKYHQLVAQYFY